MRQKLPHTVVTGIAKTVLKNAAPDSAVGRGVQIAAVSGKDIVRGRPRRLNAEQKPKDRSPDIGKIFSGNLN